MRTLIRTSACAAAVGILASITASVAATSADAASFHVFPERAFVDSVSADGTVVAGSRGCTPFRWTEATGFLDLRTPTGEIVDTAFATAISGDGSTIVGRGTGILADEDSFRWTAETGLIWIGGLPTSYDSSATSVSYDGNAVVGGSGSEIGFQPYRWTADGGFEGLGSLDSESSSGGAMGVSADGAVVVGNSRSPSSDTSGSEAFRWTRETGIQRLGISPGGRFASSAQAVSGDGLVVVANGRDENGQRGFRWTAADGLTPLPDSPDGTSFNWAATANFDGSIIVGQAFISTGPGNPSDRVALVWDEDHGTRLFQDVLIQQGFASQLEGLSLRSVEDVTDDGLTFVGTLRTQAGGLTGWAATIPEPSAAMLCLGLLACHALVRIRR